MLIAYTLTYINVVKKQQQFSWGASSISSDKFISEL